MAIFYVILQVLTDNPGYDAYCNTAFLIQFGNSKAYIIFLSGSTVVKAGMCHSVHTIGKADIESDRRQMNQPEGCRKQYNLKTDYKLSHVAAANTYNKSCRVQIRLKAVLSFDLHSFEPAFYQNTTYRFIFDFVFYKVFGFFSLYDFAVNIKWRKILDSSICISLLLKNW